MSDELTTTATVSAALDFVSLYPEPGALMFSMGLGKEVLTIWPDGRLERGRGFATDDEASMAFFDCLSRYLPTWLAALRQRTERAEAATEESKRHIEALTSFFMDNVLWVRAAEDARAFVRGLEREKAEPFVGISG